MQLPLASPPTAVDVIYLGFRVAFFTTFEAMSCGYNSEHPHSEQRGFLEQIPLLTGCAPQVQLETLLETWQSLSHAVSSGDSFSGLTLLQQCVFYCAIERLSQLAAENNLRMLCLAATAGPHPVQLQDVTWLASTLRTIKIIWPFPVEAGIVHRNADLLNLPLNQSLKFGKSQRQLISQLLDLVGRWKVSPTILMNAVSLLSDKELKVFHTFFTEFPETMVSA